jgi:hypothetical protein
MYGAMHINSFALHNIDMIWMSIGLAHRRAPPVIQAA